ncbi:ubiquitin-activating enzyme E1 1-like [Curcuma longa]|uniref:ubiquitin-activating enzyme E1 1-like n=1 Tax=Curcuma longa TaxID=136217 RepID=UPI003D9DB654
MISRKRVVEAEIDQDQAAAVADETLQKRTRGDCLISSAVAEETSVMEVDNSQVNGRQIDEDRSKPADIDEDLHSRQLAVYGRETMRRLFSSNVLVSGLQGLGAEIAKNLVLAGVKSITLHDEGNVEMWDLSSNFFFSEEDIGKNKALACVLKLQELNNAVAVTTLTGNLSKEKLSSFQVCVDTLLFQVFSFYAYTVGYLLSSGGGSVTSGDISSIAGLSASFSSCFAAANN